VHTPDVCYQGAGFTLAASPARSSAAPGEAGAEFWAARFLWAGPAPGSHRRIFWAWNAGGGWQAPDNPRLAFARYPALYKLYVIREMSKRDEPPENDPCREFMRLLLPELQEALFPAS